MYSVVLMTALTVGTAAPAHCWGRSCHSGYSVGCSCYGSYGWGGCHGYYGCGGYGCYGCAGAGYGYHGGCYGGYGTWYGDPNQGFQFGCTGCYGCHGGYSGYGIPVPIADPEAPSREPAFKDPFPPINPKKDPTKQPEEVKLPMEKKVEVPKREEDPKKEKFNEEKKGPELLQSRVKVRIEIPIGGRLYVDGNRMNATPGIHMFQTPLLTNDRKYYYDIRIEVVRDGQVLSDERRVIVQSGHDVTVSFPSLSGQEIATVQANE